MPDAGCTERPASGDFVCSTKSPWKDRPRHKSPICGSDYSAQTMKFLARTERPAWFRATGELTLTLGDYEAMAHLGDYYAEKLPRRL